MSAAQLLTDESRATDLERVAMAYIDDAIAGMAKAAVLLEAAAKLTVAPLSNGAVEWFIVRSLHGQYRTGSFDELVERFREEGGPL